MIVWKGGENENLLTYLGTPRHFFLPTTTGLLENRTSCMQALISSYIRLPAVLISRRPYIIVRGWGIALVIVERDNNNNNV